MHSSLDDILQLPGIGSGRHRCVMRCEDKERGSKGKLNGKLSQNICSGNKRCVKNKYWQMLKTNAEEEVDKKIY